MNKEIEELLNNLNKKLENYELDKKFGQLSVDSIYHLFPNEIQLLLSYIEQLEKDNKDLDKENQILFERNLKLQTNIDKAIEYVEEKGRLKYNPNELINILKGDSYDD